MPIIYNYTGSEDITEGILSEVEREALGIVYPFGSSGDTPFANTYTTYELAKSNIKALFQTEYNERVMNPDVAINLRPFLFEQITEELKISIQDTILEAIKK